jgi:hypothetical protein
MSLEYVWTFEAQDHRRPPPAAKNRRTARPSEVATARLTVNASAAAGRRLTR